MMQRWKRWATPLGITAAAVAIGAWTLTTRPVGDTPARQLPESHPPGSPLHRVDPDTVAEVSRLEATEADAANRFWHHEQVAQRLGRTIESWWDAINASSNRMAVAAQLPLGGIRIPTWDTSVSRPHDIQLHTSSILGPWLDTSAWANRIESLSAQGWRIETLEARQVAYNPGTDGTPVHSRFRLAVHLVQTSPIHRAIVEGEIDVHWVPEDRPSEPARVGQVDASRLRLLLRAGPPPFTRWLERPLDPPRNAIAADPLLVRDLDGDGRPEIVLPGVRELLRLGPDGAFSPRRILVPQPGLPYTGLLTDLDGDEAIDLVSVQHEGVVLTGSSTDGSFNGMGRIAWRSPKPFEHAMTLTAGDIDRDGDVDLFLGQYKAPYVHGSMATPCDDARDGHPGYLLLNDGKGSLRDVSEGSGLGSKLRRRTYSGSFCDLDADGWLDLALVSDFAGVDLFRNQGEGRFEDRTSDWLPDPRGLGMGHAICDFNADGNLDLLMIGMNSPTVDRLEHLGLWRPHPRFTREGRRALTRGNRLWLSRDGGPGYLTSPFGDGLAASGWSWGCTAADFDNDGWPDVAIVNGMESRASVRDIEPEFWLHDIYAANSEDNPVAHLYFRSKIERTQGRGQSYGGYEKNRLYLNQSGQEFLEMGHLMGVALEEDTRNIVGADFDADGRVDLAVVSFDRWPSPRQTLRVFRNELEESGRWIGFHLHGREDAIMGARILLETRDGKACRTVLSGDSHRSQHPATVHFGMGHNGAEPVRAEIRWADGGVSWINGPGIGRYHALTTPPNGTRKAGGSTPPSKSGGYRR